MTENPYRITADIISSTNGQTISHGGAWRLVQKLGERVTEEELQVKKMNADEIEGTRAIKVLFEEMDGVWLRLQGKDHRSIPKQEIKRKLDQDKEAARVVEELFEAEKMEEMLEYIRISAAKASKKDGKGNPYADVINMCCGQAFL